MTREGEVEEAGDSLISVNAPIIIAGTTESLACLSFRTQFGYRAQNRFCFIDYLSQTEDSRMAIISNICVRTQWRRLADKPVLSYTYLVRPAGEMVPL